MSTATRYTQASIEHLKYAQNGGALRARFADTFTQVWTQGWLVGWVQGKYNWVACYDDPDNCEAADAISDQECKAWQYCEILESDLNGV
jgi:hypothetical protein